MLISQIASLAFVAWFAAVQSSAAQPLPQLAGAPPVSITHSNHQWIIAGKKNTFLLNDRDLSTIIHA